MGLFGSDLGRAALGWGTGGLSEVYRALSGGGGGGGGYAPIPFENPNYTVDNDRIAEQFKAALGRAPSQSEIDQYSRYIKSGDLGYGEIGQILQSLPEADKARLESNTSALASRLGASDDAILGRAADVANSRFTQLGRPVTSAAAASVAGAAGQLAQQRQSALAEFYGRGLGDNSALYNQQGQNALGRGQQLADNRTAYNRSLLGYQTQRSDYNTDLGNQYAMNRRIAGQQLIGSLAGAGIGGAFGGVGGARLGAGIGGQAGGLF